MNTIAPAACVAAALVVLTTPLTTPALWAQETGTLKVRFRYGGTAPPRQPVKLSGPFCGTHDHLDESLVVNPENNGLQNVMVYVYTGRGGSKLDVKPGKPEIRELANKDCQFVPHIVLAQKGDQLKIDNPDPVGHNANIAFIREDSVNPTIAAGKFVMVDLKQAEPAPIPVSCSIHPWMKALVLVLDHPFMGLSNQDGEVVIKGLPVGKKLVFRAQHERASIKEVTIDGNKEKWKRSRFEISIKPGVNDMGTVVIGADQFRAQ